MVTMKVSALAWILLVISLSSSSCAHAHGHAAAGGHHDFVVVASSSLKHIAQDAVCTGHKVMPSGNRIWWVPMNRPYGPCSSSPVPNDFIEGVLRWDQLRTSYIRRELSNGHVDEDLPIITGTNDEHVAQMETLDAARTRRGKPGVRQTFVVDTSSDISWVQCLPCPVPKCHLQKDQFYDPASSSDYAPISCASRACTELGSSYSDGCTAAGSGGQCKYQVKYADGRATAGTYITDTLTLGDGTTVIQGFRFGCSHSVKGLFSDQTAGVLALGGGPQSLRAQVANTYGDAFSLCIPHPSSLGFLSLGGPPVGLLPRFASTPLVKNPRAPTFYIVRLEAITVAGKRLGVPPAVFAAGAVMDSNAVITQLPSVAYTSLRAAFRSVMAAYPLAAPMLNLDTCYDFSRFPMVTVPKVSLVFAGGATVQLDATSVMLDGCLAFAATPGNGSVGFIGNVQQQGYEVLYNVGGGSVGFRGGAC